MCIRDSVCATTAFREEDLSALAARQLNELAQRVKARLGLTLQAGEDLRNAAAAQGSARQGAEPVLSYTERLFKALSQYVLEQEPPAGGTVRLEVREGRVTAFSVSYTHLSCGAKNGWSPWKPCRNRGRKRTGT